MKEKRGYSRRDFLKVVGASAGLATASCKPEVQEKLIPYVVQPNEVVPGVSTWYSGTCNQCSSGCGWVVRTREGRALKVEGDREHPINKGGLCAQAQSSLQELYDPDRLREPVVRSPLSDKPEEKVFKAASWRDALGKVAEQIEKLPAGKEAVIVTGPLSGSLKSLLEDLVQESSQIRHVIYDPHGRDVVDVATEVAFGPGARVEYDFSKADVVVGVGADYLETWLSPVEFSRQWASRRVAGHHMPKSDVTHFEPRFSLTAANADKWVQTAPGVEVDLLLALLQEIVEQGGATANIDRSLLNHVLDSHRPDTSKLPMREIKQTAKKLIDAKHSLVVAGGASTRLGGNGVNAIVVAHLINTAVGNVGQSIKLRRVKEKAMLSDVSMSNLIQDMSGDDPKVGVVMFCGINPAFTLPQKSGFKEAVANTRLGLVVSATTKLDETARLAHVALPLSTAFESWGDSEPKEGVQNLNQPAMQPLYTTQSLGDTLLALAGMLGKTFAGAKSFKDYIQAKWEGRGNWTEFVQAGGRFSRSYQDEKLELTSSLRGHSFAGATIGKTALLAFPTVRSSTGESANRPWMQELPDPLSSIVWDSWVELHPKKAKKIGVESGDLVQIKTDYGALEAAALVTEHIHPDLMAIPIGQGHESYGRYANGIGVNPLSVLAPLGGRLPADRMVGVTGLQAGLLRKQSVSTQEFYKQYNRGVLRTVPAAEVEDHSGHSAHGHSGHGPSGHGSNGHQGESHGESHGIKDDHDSGHHDPLALGPQPEPKQMYVQMKHPVYRWGMSIDLASCTGCSACVVACYAENNIPVVGKELCRQGREMSWIRVDHYKQDNPQRPITGFQPMMCQHCNNAPCEPVCPVYATYHNEMGLNTMVYNRCVGTRYCSNNCSYKVRRFNWFKYDWPEPLNWQLNPDVTVREVGVMEKCTFCVQRIREAENTAKNEGRLIKDGEVRPACASSCPTGAIEFGNLKDSKSRVSKKADSGRGYRVLDSQINTQPAVTYLARVTDEEGKQSSSGKHDSHGA